VCDRTNECYVELDEGALPSEAAAANAAAIAAEKAHVTSPVNPAEAG